MATVQNGQDDRGDGNEDTITSILADPTPYPTFRPGTCPIQLELMPRALQLATFLPTRTRMADV
jgi:hypothetical protein